MSQSGETRCFKKDKVLKRICDVIGVVSDTDIDKIKAIVGAYTLSLEDYYILNDTHDDWNYDRDYICALLSELFCEGVENKYYELFNEFCSALYSGSDLYISGPEPIELAKQLNLEIKYSNFDQ